MTFHYESQPKYQVYYAYLSQYVDDPCHIKIYPRKNSYLYGITLKVPVLSHITVQIIGLFYMIAQITEYLFNVSVSALQDQLMSTSSLLVIPERFVGWEHTVTPQQDSLPIGQLLNTGFTLYGTKLPNHHTSPCVPLALIYLTIPMVTCLPACLPASSLAHSLTHLFTHSLTHSLIYINQFIHLFTNSKPTILPPVPQPKLGDMLDRNKSKLKK